MKIEQKVEVFITGKNIKYYKEKGYQAVCKEKIMVNCDDLPQKSHIMEKRICDCCSKEYSKQHRELLRTFECFGEDICPECSKTEKYINISKEKQKRTNQDRYGVDWTQQNKEISKKRKETCILKYGSESPFGSEEIQEKIHNINFERYGVEMPLQSKEIRQKCADSCMEKYGVDNPFKVKDIQDGIKQHNQENYGVDYPFQSDSIQAKVRESFYKNGTCATSSQQIKLEKIIKELFPNNKVELNYPLSRISLDIYLRIGEIDIDIEYDCKYWHNQKKDRRRDEFVKSQGYKVFRIKSKRLIPEKEQILNKIEKLLEGKNYTEIILKDWDT